MKTRSKAHGFSLVELVIVVVIIGVIAAIAVPRISRGSKGAGDAALRASLAGIRNAIDMYAAEHGGAFPDGADQATIEGKLIQKTDFDGTVNASGDYGPYLRSGFPPVPVGQRVSLDLLLANVGSEPLQLLGDGIRPTSSPFVLESALPGSLPAGASTTVTVSLRPTEATTARAELTIDAAVPDSPLVVALRGSGGLPAASTDRAAHDFGTLVYGDADTATDITDGYRAG